MADTVRSEKYAEPVTSTEKLEGATAEHLLAEVSGAQPDPTTNTATFNKCDEPVASIEQTEANSVKPYFRRGIVDTMGPCNWHCGIKQAR